LANYNTADSIRLPNSAKMVNLTWSSSSIIQLVSLVHYLPLIPASFLDAPLTTYVIAMLFIMIQH